MSFNTTYKAYVGTEGNAGTMEEVGKQFIADYLQDMNGTETDKVARAYARLDDAFKGCGPIVQDRKSIINLECFVHCSGLLSKEAGRK